MMSDKRECCPKCGSPWCDSPQIIGGGGGEPQAANNPRNASIPYTSAYFGCCNRTVQTRADIAQPKYCPFCGKALAAQPKGTLEQVIGREDVISVCGKHSVQFCDQEDCYICAKREPAPSQPAFPPPDTTEAQSKPAQGGE